MSVRRFSPSVSCLRISIKSRAILGRQFFLQRTSELFHGELREVLDRALIFAPSLHIDRLVLSLGTFDDLDWEAELCARLRMQLEQQVRAWKLESASELKAESDLVVADLEPTKLTPLKEFTVPRIAYIDPIPHPEKLAQASLQSGQLTFWLKRLTITTITSITTMLADGIPSAPLSRKHMAEVLPLSALVYYQCHPQIPVPARPVTWQALPVAISVTTLRTWLPRMLAYPLRAEVRQWLYLLCSTAEAKTCLTQALATITPAQVRASNSPLPPTAFELPTASAQSLPLSVPPERATPSLPLSASTASAQPTPRPEPPIRTNSGMTWPIHEAGLVLLWPLLPSLFKKMGLLVDQQWVQPESHYHALRCLQALVWGEGPLMWGEDWPDSALLRWLCGMPLGLPLAAPDGFEDNPDDLAELDAWLARPPTAPLDNWSDFSLAELRERFLQRPGKLSLQGGRWSLEIELEPGTKTPPPVPWPVSVLSYPWLTQPLYLSFYEAASVG